jgi:hypothetical protein
MMLIETDDRGRMVLPGHPHQKFLVQENSDGSVLLLPVRVVSEAQAEFDQSPALRELLARAARSTTARRSRKHAV